MNYRVLLLQTEEGFAIFCPALPGCATQGETEAEALENMRDAATLWLDCGGIPAADGGKEREAELLREIAEEGLVASVREIGLTVTA